MLIPSFSSRGFGLAPTGRGSRRLRSEASQYLRFHAPTLTETFLVSAYDLHHKLFEDAERVRSKFDKTVFADPGVLFVDSGLYEYRLDADAEEPLQSSRLPSAWDHEALGELLDKMIRRASNLALISWDSYQPYRDQIEHAQLFLSRYRERALQIILLKPEASGSFYDLDRLTPEVDRLAAFNIIGVTEKELGSSVIERAVKLARLRDLLDDHEIPAPVHVFGGLDPLYIPLYYAAGAEIFDGLTWLRYAYISGVAVHRDAWSLLRGQNDKDALNSILTAQRNNLDEIEILTRKLKRFRQEQDWTLFGESRAGPLEDAYLGMESAL